MDKNNMIMDNEKFVWKMANKYAKYGYEVEDLHQVGMIGLIKAANKFDEEKGLQFLTFASRCIENEILMYLRNNRKHCKNISMETIVNDDERKSIRLWEMFVSNENTDENLINNCEKSIILNTINSCLSEKESKIICMSFGINCNAITQNEIAAKMNLSQSYVSRIYRGALLKLKQKLLKEW